MAKPPRRLTDLSSLPHLNTIEFQPAPEVYRFGCYTIPRGEDIGDHMMQDDGLKGLGEGGWSICGMSESLEGTVVLLQRKLIPAPPPPKSPIEIPNIVGLK